LLASHENRTTIWIPRQFSTESIVLDEFLSQNCEVSLGFTIPRKDTRILRGAWRISIVLDNFATIKWNFHMKLWFGFNSWHKTMGKLPEP
jgi:hypothetical protein